MLKAVLCAALFVCLAACLPPLPARAHGHLSPDAEVNAARELIRQGDYPAALLILRRHAAQAHAPAHRHDVLFLIGLAAMRRAETAAAPERQALLDEAIAAFEAILAEAPALLRVRAELARALFLARRYAEAERHFVAVLEAQPPAAMAANVAAFLQKIRAARRRNSYLSFSIAPSSNVNAGTDNRVIILFDNLPFRLGEESRPQSGVGLLVRGGGEYQQPLSAQWRWRFGADAARSEYRNRPHDRTHLSIHTGPRYAPSEKSDSSARLTAGQAWLGGRRHYRWRGARLDTAHRLSPRWSVSAGAAWQKRRYRRRPAADGAYIDYRLGTAYRLSPRLQGEWQGVFSAERPRSRRDRSRQWRLLGGVTLFLPRGWQASAALQRGRRKFEGASFIVPSDRRRDRLTAFRFSLFNPALTLGGLSPQLSVARERQESNSALHEFQRDYAELNFIRRF